MAELKQYFLVLFLFLERWFEAIHEFVCPEIVSEQLGYSEMMSIVLKCLCFSSVTWHVR